MEVKIDNELTFDCNVSDMCKKANTKINALARISPFTNINKRRILMNSFFGSQFNYCPLCGCAITEKTTEKEMDSMKDV